MSYILFILCLAIYCQAQHLNQTPLIYLGDVSRVKNEKFTCVVSIQLVNLRRNICTGSLISRRHVLTTAYCVDLTLRVAKEWQIIAGSKNVRNWSSNTRKFGISGAFIHPDRKATVEYDMNSDNIGIFVLDTHVFQSEFISYVLSFGGNVSDGDLLTVCGWGRIYFSKPISDVLESSLIKAANRSFCGSGDGNKTICLIGSNNEFKPSFSGSPAFLDKTLVGIHSNKNVFLRISNYINWIKTTIANHSVTQGSVNYKRNLDLRGRTYKIEFSFYLLIFSVRWNVV